MNLLRALTKSWTVTAAVTAWVALATPAWAGPFRFSTGSADGLLGALSQPARSGKLETETADDFILTETTSLAQATITGLVTPGTSLGNIQNVEVEVYRLFPNDSDATRKPSVPTRMNSPADVEIETATRDGSLGTLTFAVALVHSGFTVGNTVVNNLIAAPADNVIHGEGPASGDLVQITVTFDPPILLPPGHYFFRPEVRVSGSDFLYASAPRTVPPATGDLQAWIRNSALNPDWLRIGTDIIAGPNPRPTFNMTFSLTGDTIPDAGTPGQADCHGQTVSALATQFRGLHAAAAHLHFSSVAELQRTVTAFCTE
jgi:hypothetical protein